MINLRYWLPNLSSQQIFMTKSNLRVFTRKILMLNMELLFCQYEYAFQETYIKFIYGHLKQLHFKKN